jgi:isocitrate dehydrogenase (NAD+)
MVTEAAGATITWVEGWAGLKALEQFGDPLPAETLDLIRRHRVALKGPCHSFLTPVPNSP